MKSSLKKVELEFLRNVCEKVDDPIVNPRLCYLFEWYTRKAQHNKRWYNWTRFITYLIPCLITLISVYAAFIQGDSKWAIAVTATLSAALVGIHHVIDHFRFYENWVRYRGTAEKLKTEAELYLNHCAPYNKGSAKENKQRFANRVERITKAELANWENLLEESHKPFKEENHAALQTGSNPADPGQLQNSSQEAGGLSGVSAFAVPSVVPEGETNLQPEDYADSDDLREN